MRAAAMLTILAIELLSVYWLHDSELTGICVGAGLLVALCGGGTHARHQ
jgi:hypothetical protein